MDQDSGRKSGPVGAAAGQRLRAPPSAGRRSTAVRCGEPAPPPVGPGAHRAAAAHCPAARAPARRSPRSGPTTTRHPPPAAVGRRRLGRCRLPRGRQPRPQPHRSPGGLTPRGARLAASGSGIRPGRRGRTAGCGASPPGSRRRTSPAPRRPAPAPPSPRPPRPPRARRTRRSAGGCACAASPVATSTVRSARGTVEIGFIATRTRTGSPLVMPPSMPPARLVSRLTGSPGSISSCAALPRRRAVRNPSPISTPFMAWMPISTPASRASRRRSDCTYEPSPTGRPYAITSTTPPRVSPSTWAASTSATIAAVTSSL